MSFETKESNLTTSNIMETWEDHDVKDDNDLDATILNAKDDVKEKRAELYNWNKSQRDLIEMITRARKKTLKYKKLLEDWETSEATLKFKWEQERARNLGLLWVSLVLLLLALTFHTHDKGAHAFTFLNGIAFLANWRMLYVKNAPGAIVFGLVVSVVTCVWI